MKRKSIKKTISIITATITLSINANPTLNDLFKGKAKFANEEEVTLNFNDSEVHVFGQKMNIFTSIENGNTIYYTFTRELKVENGRQEKRLVLMSSNDALKWNKVDRLFESQYSNGWVYYDAHVIETGNPRKPFLMVMECGQHNILGPSTCISHSATPFQVASWSTPVPIVKPKNLQSSSTPTLLADDGRIYLSWSLVDDRSGQQVVYTKAVELFENSLGNRNFVYKGFSPESGKSLVKPNSSIHSCSDYWDCKNIDFQDWKREGQYFYAAYNGADHFRDKLGVASRWDIGIRRSTHPLGDYSESSGVIVEPNINSSNEKDTYSYSVINEIDGETYIYYNKRSSDETGYPSSTDNQGQKIRTYRQKLISAISYPAFTTDTKDTGVDSIVNLDHIEIDRAISLLYTHILNRSPKASEIEHHRANAQNLGLKKVARIILNSTEHLNGRWSTTTPAQKVIYLYAALLDRSASSSATQALIEKINEEDLNTYSGRNAVFNRIIHSAEYTDLVNETMSKSRAVTKRLYSYILNRMPSENDLIAADSKTPQELAIQVLDSQEHLRVTNNIYSKRTSVERKRAICRGLFNKPIEDVSNSTIDSILNNLPSDPLNHSFRNDWEELIGENEFSDANE